MTKEEFLRRYELTEMDYRNLKRFEEVRRSGTVSMFEYLEVMRRQNVNGGARLASKIVAENFYKEFRDIVEVSK